VKAVPELVWIVDPATGDLVVEGLEAEEALAVAGDLLPPPVDLNCARPLATVPLPESRATQGPVLRVRSLYHASVVEGPGRRSVLQTQGCTLACPQCFTPESHPMGGGVALPVEILVDCLLDPIGEPRDGVTVLGGEPFLQPSGLAALLHRLKARGVHTVVYSGFTLEALARRPDPAVHAALSLTDLLIEGPFVSALAEGAGEWRGSRNQRLIPHPTTVRRESRSTGAGMPHTPGHAGSGLHHRGAD
jgi:anaerobic ribonucleoside-triphosphate reductase activating protein